MREADGSLQGGSREKKSGHDAPAQLRYHALIICDFVIRSGVLLLLEAESGEFQGPAIFGNGTDDILRSAGFDLGLDFEGDLDRRADQPGEMGDDLVGDAPGVAADPRRAC
jgi:hypothetical protein